MKIRTQFSGKSIPSDSIQTGASKTVPDMSLTIPELLRNHTRGIHSEINQAEALYFDTEIPNIQDITDLEEYKLQLKQRQKEVEIKLKQEAAEIKEAKQKIKDDKVKQTIPTPPPTPPTDLKDKNHPNVPPQ